MIKSSSILVLSVLLISCGKGKHQHPGPVNSRPVVSEGGNTITFTDTASLRIFETEQIKISDLTDDFIAPAKVGTLVTSSQQGAFKNIVLFDNPELSGNYSQLLEHQINIDRINNVTIKQRKIELDRLVDLKNKSAATEKDVLEAQTLLSIEQSNLENEKAALIEHETKLKIGGYDPQELKKAPAGTVFIICDVPESQLERIKKGMPCALSFAAVPDMDYKGKVDDIADMIDATTRMIKVRIIIFDKDKKLKVGMFGSASFDIDQPNCLSINDQSLVTVQGKNYVFVKTNDHTFERRAVNIGVQIGSRVMVYGGLKENEWVVTKGVMQLKGLSFGY